MTAFIHNVEMDRETYITPIVEAYIPDSSFAEKLVLTQEFWALFDCLNAQVQATKRFDSQGQKMVETDSLTTPTT